MGSACRGNSLGDRGKGPSAPAASLSQPLRKEAVTVTITETWTSQGKLET